MVVTDKDEGGRKFRQEAKKRKKKGDERRTEGETVKVGWE